MHILRAAFLFVLCFVATTNFCAHKIIYLISTPRSLSVAFLRMMQVRGDFFIMHEPSQLAWILSQSNDTAQSWYRPEAFRSFDEVKKAIIHAAEDQPVFAKEMSFAVNDFHQRDHELMQNPQAYFVFLVRNPHHVTISMYNRVTDIFDAVARVEMPDLVGYKALYEVFQEVKIHAANAPYIMSTEELYTNPTDTIKKFCAHVGIDFKPESLQWESLGADFDAYQEWHEGKYKDAVYHWHENALKSTGFTKPTAYEVDGHGVPTFHEIKNDEHRVVCRAIYEDHLRFYELLMANKVNM